MIDVGDGALSFLYNKKLYKKPVPFAEKLLEKEKTWQKERYIKKVLNRKNGRHRAQKRAIFSDNH